jgi:transposase
MKNTSTSLFRQVLNIIPKHKFEEIIMNHKADKHKQSFDSWSHFVSMIFCQLAQANSLREICGGLKTCGGKLNHLGVDCAPSKSNLSYANKHRDPEVFKKVFFMLLGHCKAIAPRHKFTFKKKLYSLDATLIELCVKSFPWATYRRTKGAVKLHMLLDHDGYLPVFMDFTKGNVHEVNSARHMDIPRDSMIACDRGYIDYSMLYNWHRNGVQFVSRLKSNALYEVLEYDLAQYDGNVLSDETIYLSGAMDKYPEKLRKVVVCDMANHQTLTLLTNNFELDAQTIGDIYKERWQIESFFKMLKQNFKIKAFVGTSENAVKIQVWTALIAVLLLKCLKFMSKAEWHFSTLVTFLKWNLFVYRDLQQWLDQPFTKPPEPVSLQLEFDFRTA